MISVLVVDDSVVVRRLVVDALSGDVGINVVGTAANGKLAQYKIDQLKPDVVTMDIEMPEMDGIEAVRVLRRRHPRLPVIMFSTLSAAGATATLDALAAGATDYVTKPANTGSVVASIKAVREQLVPRIHALAPGRLRPRPARPPAAAGGTTRDPAGHRPPATGVTGTRAPTTAHPRPPDRTGPQPRVEVLAVGCSTGGPDALSKVLSMLPPKLAVPILVVQHMPPLFTRMFAERLNRNNSMSVVEAVDGQAVRSNNVYIAPGDRHLSVVRRGTEVYTKLSDGPPENSCRPAVDVLFRSIATVYGGATVATVLTGMGQDGRRACDDLRAAGATIVAQDEFSSVVWGMPGAVVEAGLADVVLPLGDIAAFLSARVDVGRTSPLKAVNR